MIADWGLVETSETITINHNVTDMTNIYAKNNIDVAGERDYLIIEEHFL